VQTPQVFRRAALERALMGASDSALAAATDDAWLVEQAGGVVEVVESSPANLKITTPTDLTLAELLLAEARA
jgi:2-C-methyl-D-erythritol 4-phosphate cytidylyltransferase